ncbi:RNA polymerase sigma-70 factor (TIGR02943 family) [Pedobacter sp. UYP30]|uniref:sigma-70 family RNA polymerase sigma factor n=1 Tax=Pedobacter sp. UYP30 TaxID=1756400 RepID=UPI003393E170
MQVLTEEEIIGDQKRNLNPHCWVANYADYLFTYAFSRINDEERARDLVQDTFLAALEKLDNFEGRSTERTWLTAILKYKVIDVYRSRASRTPNGSEKEVHDGSQQNFFDSVHGNWNQEYWPKEIGIEEPSTLITKEFNHILQQCMKKLPALWISVFTMKHIDEEVTSVICTELKLTPSNFWVIIHRTKVNLRACLQKNWI